MSFDVQDAELRTLFSEVGTVTDVFVPSDRATGRPRGFAFVEYGDEAGAAAAIARFDGYELHDRALRVNVAQAARPRPGGPRFSDTDSPPPFPPRRGKSKGSRRNLRARKRSL